MKYIHFFSILSLLLFNAHTSRAQDTLLLLNGKTKLVNFSHQSSEFIVYSKPGKEKLKSKDKLDIFSVKFDLKTKADSLPESLVLYKVDSSMGDFFTIPEMKDFLHGKQQAHKNHKELIYAVGGVGVGFCSAYIGDPRYTAIPVVSYVVISGSWVLKPWKRADDKSWFNNLHFNAGYKETARRRQALYAGIGSLIGLAIGYPVFDRVLSN